MARASWRTTGVILVSAALILGLSMGLRQTFGLFLAPMSQALSIGRADFGLAIAVQNLVWGLFTPFVGMLAERYGTARFVALGGLLYGGGVALMAAGDSLLTLQLGGGLMVGFAISAAGFPLVLAVVARNTAPERRSTMLGIASAGGSVGQFLLLPGSQALIDGLGWQDALWVLAALSLLIVPLAAAMAGKPAASSGQQQSLGAALREAGGHGGYLLLTLGFFVCGFQLAFVATHLPGYVVSCNLDAGVGATALGIVGFFNIIGGVGAGWLGGRLPKKYLLSGIYFARAVAIALLLASPKTEWTLWLFSAAFGVLWLSTVPLTSGLVAQIFGARYMATLFGIVMLSHQLGSFFGAWSGGLAFDLYGNYDSVWYVSIALGVMAALVHLPIADRPLRSTASAT